MTDHEDEDLTDDEKLALVALKLVTGLIAQQYSICPLCLTYAMANMVEDAEDAGLVHHWATSGGDPAEPQRTPEEIEKADATVKKLGELLRTFQAGGTKH